MRCMKGNHAMQNLIIRNPAGLYNIMRRRAESFDNRQAMCVKRRAFCACALRLDSLLSDENGNPRENSALSDGEAGAGKIRACREEPLWRELFALAYAVQSEKDKRVIDALMDDMRVSAVAKASRTNRLYVYRLLAKLRKDFAPAYAAWKLQGGI